MGPHQGRNKREPLDSTDAPLHFSSLRLLADSQKPQPVPTELSKSQCGQDGISWDHLIPHARLILSILKIKVFLSCSQWAVTVEVFRVIWGALLRKKSPPEAPVLT